MKENKQAILFGILLCGLFSIVNQLPTLSYAASDTENIEIIMTAPSIIDLTIVSGGTIDENPSSTTMIDALKDGEYAFLTSVDLSVTCNESWVVSAKAQEWTLPSGHRGKEASDLEVSVTENYESGPYLNEDLSNGRHLPLDTNRELEFVFSESGTKASDGNITCAFKVQLDPRYDIPGTYRNTVVVTATTWA